MDSGYKKQVVKLRLIGWMNTLFFGLCAAVDALLDFGPRSLDDHSRTA